MSGVLLISKNGARKQLNLSDELPADGSLAWAKGSWKRVTREWLESNHACPALGQQFTNNNGLSIITEGDLTDVYRHFLGMPESKIARVADQLTPLAAASISQPLAGGKHCNALAFAATPHRNGVSLLSHGYGRTAPETVITGSPYKEGANVVAHELAHAGDRNVAGITGLHSNSPLFETVIELDRVHSGNKSALAHTEAFYRQAGGILGNTRNEETLARMVENVMHNPQGEFHPLVKSYVNNVFLKDMELKAAGREDMRKLLHQMTNFGEHPELHTLYQSIKNPAQSVDAKQATAKTLSFIDTISQRFGVTQPTGERLHVLPSAISSPPPHLNSAGSAESNIIRNIEKEGAHGGKAGWIIGSIAVAGAAALGLWAMVKSKEKPKKNSPQEKLASVQNTNSIPHPADNNKRSWTAMVDTSRSGAERSL